jgi:ring-1,2-phenylacetyl-CoA epoxidase subunit PaaD
VTRALDEAGFPDASVETVLSPAWTTDMITPAGRAKLAEAGIAPPGPVLMQIGVRCVHCGSSRTEELSRFSSTACKAMWRCRDCGEPFERIKPL